jgi:hypothetical protein
VQEHALRINVADLQAQAFAQAQAAGVDGAQTDALIQQSNTRENAADLTGGEDDGEFELRIGPDQGDLSRPGKAEGLFPKELDRADGLGGGLAGDFPVGLEMEEIVAEILGGEEVGGLLEEVGELAEAVPVAQDGAFGQGEELKVVEEAI